jgi:diguanylate cyclase (GGDEF)-like protein
MQKMKKGKESLPVQQEQIADPHSPVPDTVAQGPVTDLMQEQIHHTGAAQPIQIQAEPQQAPPTDMRPEIGPGAAQRYIPVDPKNSAMAMPIQSITPTIAPAYEQAQAPQKEPWPQTVQRIEEPGVQASFNKLHGIYTTPGDVESPHTDLGGQRYEWKLNPEAKTIDIPSYQTSEVVMRKGAVNAGAGVHAARHFLGADEFKSLKGMSKAELARAAQKKYLVDFGAYHDKQEIMEAIGALEARKAGYDAFRVLDPDDHRFTEIVLLNKRAVLAEESHITPKPDTQPAQKAPAMKPQAPQAKKALPDIRTFFINSGGISLPIESKGGYSGELRKLREEMGKWEGNKLVRTLKVGGAVSLDDALTRAKEAGYLPEDATQDDLIEALREKKPHPVTAEDALPAKLDIENERRENMALRRRIERNISRLKKEDPTLTNDELRELSFIDKDTGLPNKLAYERDLDKNMDGVTVAIDMNGLKYVNDTFGHGAGDEFINQFGAIMQTDLGSHFYRIGGDEFAAIFPNRQDADDAMSTLQEVVKELQFEITANDGSVLVVKGVTFSYGTGQGRNAKEHKQSADAELYRDKARAKARGDRPSEPGAKPPRLSVREVGRRDNIDPFEDNSGANAGTETAAGEDISQSENIALKSPETPAAPKKAAQVDMFGAKTGLEGPIRAESVDLSKDNLFPRDETVKQETAREEDEKNQTSLIDEQLESGEPHSGPHIPLDVSAQQSGQGANTRISDFGEKIGGARKDTSESGYSRPSKSASTDTPKSWRKNYVVMENVNGGGWVIGRKQGRFASGQEQVFATREEAEAAIPLYAVADKYQAYKNDDGTWSVMKRVSDRKLLKMVAETFPSREAAMKYMATHAEELLDKNTAFGEEIFPIPETAIRQGIPRRNGNATPEMFMETFSPRGIEFGNWNSQEERQQVMNHAYDALLDLAEVLNVPPKALMLNGELSIAFGARGRGLSGVKAHYERDYGVINLTKMKGAGSLAHEWFHAFDHYMARLDTKAKSFKVPNERGDLVYPRQSTTATMQSYGASYKSQIRPELQAAYNDLINSMYKKAEKYVEDTQKADKFLAAARDRLRKTLDTVRDMLQNDYSKYKKRFGAPATAEQLAEFDRLADILVEGGNLDTYFLPNEKRKFSGRYTNDTLEAINSILKAVRNRSGFDSTKSGILDDVVQDMWRYRDRLKMFEDAKSGAEKTKNVPTNYIIEARKMDQARSGDYWSEPPEMAARAFAAYVEDKLSERGWQSDFLVYHAHGGMILPMIDGFIARPYPEGKEREAINNAIDRLVGTLETKETENGNIMLYSGIHLPTMIDQIRTTFSKGRDADGNVSYEGIREVDLKALEDIWNLPNWIAQEHPEFMQHKQIEVDRQERREEMLHELLQSPTQNRAGEHHEFLSLSKEDEAAVAKLIVESDADNRLISKKELEERGITTPQMIAYYAWKRSMDKALELRIENYKKVSLIPYEDRAYYDKLREIVDMDATGIEVRQRALELASKMPQIEADAFLTDVDSLTPDKGSLKELRAQLEGLNFYMPRTRGQGEYVARVRDKDGNVIWSERTTSNPRGGALVKIGRALRINEAKRIEKRLRAEFPDARIEWKHEPHTPEFMYQEMTDAAIERFLDKTIEKVREGGKISSSELNAVKDAIKQTLVDDLKARGFGKHAIHRKQGAPIGGYKTEGLKQVFVDYMSGAAGFMSKSEAAMRHHLALQNLPNAKPRLMQYAQKYVKDMMRNQTKIDRVSGRLRAMAYTWYLMGNIRFAAVQMTQNYVAAIPELSTHTKRATWKYHKAMSQIASGQGLTAEEKAALDKAYNAGITKDQYLKEVTARIHGGPRNAWRKTIDALSIPFRGMEIFNRKSSFLAAWRVAKYEKNMSSDEAYSFARQFVDNTQFWMSKANLPGWARGEGAASGIARTLYTFKSFQQNYMLLLRKWAKQGPDGYRAIAYSMAWLAAFGGAGAVPFLDDILDLIEQITGYPARKIVKDRLKKYGDVVAKIGTQGIPALIGVDLSGSLKMEVPFLKAASSALTLGQVNAGGGASDVWGVYSGLGQKAAKGAHFASQKEMYRAAEQLAPVFIENAMKGYRQMSGPVLDDKGRPMFDERTGKPLVLSTAEGIGQMAGFRPARTADISKEKRMAQNLDGYFDRRRADITEAYRYAAQAKDKDALRKVLDDIKEYNKDAMKYPKVATPITGQTLQRALKPKQNKAVRAFLGLDTAD